MIPCLNGPAESMELSSELRFEYEGSRYELRSVAEIADGTITKWQYFACGPMGADEAIRRLRAMGVSGTVTGRD